MDNGTFTTTDLGLASLLYALGIPFFGVEFQKEGDWKKVMLFATPSEEVIAGWQSGTILVNALAMHRASRDIKHRLKAG